MRGVHRAIVATLVLLAVAAVSLSGRGEDAAVPPDDQQPSSVVPPSSPMGKQPAAQEVIDTSDAQGVLGRQVRSSANENMGHIVDVIVDRAGQVRAAVIDFGGFLGVGSRKIAVDWSALQFASIAKPGGRITLELTRDQVKQAPEYKPGKPVTVLGASGRLEPLRFTSPITPEK